jgi:hypothetical protein
VIVLTGVLFCSDGRPFNRPRRPLGVIYKRIVEADPCARAIEILKCLR